MGELHPDEGEIDDIIPVIGFPIQRISVLMCPSLQQSIAGRRNTDRVRVLARAAGFTYNMSVQFRYLFLAVLFLGLAGVTVAQQSPPVEQVPVDKSAPAPKDNSASPPRSDNIPAGESSSKQTQIDVSPPANDAKAHPEAGLGDSDVDEFTPYNPMKAMKGF